jgi:hypothetical protein
MSKVKYQDQELTQTVTLADGVASTELAIPTLAAGDAAVLKRVIVDLEASSTIAPSIAQE